MKQLLLFVMLLGGLTAFSQGTVTGTVTDTDLGGALPGANVVESGTNNGAVTDFDGNFTLTVSSNSGTIEISYLGFKKQTVSFTLTNGSSNLGTVGLMADANTLSEVVIVGTGVIDLAEDRQTPVAVSTIKAEEIRSKTAGNREFMEAIQQTPSVYVSNQAGGFGDSQVFLRGFDQINTAFLLNGQPINGMEDGRMYWSNWSGMSDVANAIQVQRGLGSSKLAISSVGGTVNIVSKTTDKKQGGFARFLVGNDSYFKGTAGYDTGLSEGGWAFSVLLDHWQAFRKYSIGTAGQGQNYLFSVGYKPNEKHAFNFLITGAPQWHDQNFSVSLDKYKEYGEKYNPNTGFLDGERYTERRNYYHKPVANLNWDFNINDNMDLSTVLYASWGRGGGTGNVGSSGNKVVNKAGEVDFEQIRENNIADNEDGIGTFGSSYMMRSSVNNHNWYGLLSNLNFEVGQNWSFNVGVDGRMYHGDHFRQMTDFLGLSGYNDNFGTDRPDTYVISEAFEANPWASLTNFADEGQRFQYDYSEDINYIGGFGQAEFATDVFSIFAQGAYSSQSYQREGRFTGSGDGVGTSDKVSKTGYNIKGGMSLEFVPQHTLFVNSGFYSRQPFLDNIFVDIRNSNTLADPEVDNEEIFGIEGGYRLDGGEVRLSFDLYYTEWGNRFLAFSGSSTTEVDGEDVTTFFTTRMTDVTQLHKGIELDIRYRPSGGCFTLNTWGQVGDWQYKGTTPFTQQDDDSLEFLITDGEANLSGTKVGNAPQTQFGAGLNVDLVKGQLSWDVDYIYNKDLYEFVDPVDVAEASLAGTTYKNMKLDPYSLVNTGITYKFNFGNQKLVFRGNVYNLFNNAYINQSDAFGVYLGIGRTYNASLRLNF